MPSDPKELVLLAAKSNGLLGDEIQPWHLKASFKILDKKGAVEKQGIVEEFWSGTQKARLTYTVAGESQTTYWTAEGISRSGTLSEIPSSASEIQGEIVDPLPDPAFLQNQTFELLQRASGGGQLDCVLPKVAKVPHMLTLQSGVSYCFSASVPILRVSVSQSGKMQVLHNKIVRFQGRYLPEDLEIAESDKLIAGAHIDIIELLQSNDPALFVPPPEAKPLPQISTISSGAAQILLLKSVAPHYPVPAKEWRIQGTVSIQIVIQKDGTVSDVKVIDGPAELQNAAVEAVKQWTYRPYVMNGQPVEVITTVKVTFTLSG